MVENKQQRSNRPAQKHQGEVRSFKEAFIHVFLKDHTTFWQGVLIAACLYEFFTIRDAAWIFTAFALIGGSSSHVLISTERSRV